ncbi:septation protein SepH [Actinomadura formosensis]|uniref:septation protein SepH n=1 Tax=Actinomadura formosensis TaxID=60706 RepID=UPI0008336E95|nr:septation protein SepH [Actinomadura formosensis]
MQELRLVAVSEDGTYLVLATAGRGTRFTLPVDDRLRAAVRGHFSRLGQFEIEVESPLRPKEIQARIRSGETAEEIAESAGIPVERVRWFEGPVLQEREYMAQQAQRVAVRRPGESTPGPPLGETVEERLGRGGVDLEEAEWDSWKCEDSTWRVRLSFFEGGRPYAAEWTFDPRRRHVSPLDEVAARLTSVEWDDDVLSDTVTPLVPRRPAMKVVAGDRAPAARGLPADPGAPEPLRAAEPREYLIERGRMTDPRSPFRETSEPPPLREAARPWSPEEAREQEIGEAREGAQAGGPGATALHDVSQAPGDARPQDEHETAQAGDTSPAHDEHELGEDRENAQAGEPGTAGDASQTRGDVHPRDEDESDEAREGVQAAESGTATPHDSAQTTDAVRAQDERESDEDRQSTRADEPGTAALHGTSQAPGDRPQAERDKDEAGEAAHTDERELGEDRENAQAGESAAAEPHDAPQTPGAAQPRDEPETAQIDADEEARAGEPHDVSQAPGDARPQDEHETAQAGDTSPAHDERELGEDRENAQAGEPETAEPQSGGGETARSVPPRDEDESGDAAQRQAITRAGDGGAAAGRSRGAAAQPRTAEAPGAEKPSPAKRPAAQRQAARPPAKKKPASRPTMPAAQDKPVTGSPAAAANGESAAAQRPARRRKPKGKRASVPSWDEIMFGARRPD